MPFIVTMPKLSPTMEEGTISKWFKKEGEFVKAGELLLEIATDKATIEYQALDEGYLRKILLPEGGGAPINAPLAIFAETKEESIESLIPKKPQEPSKEQMKAPETSPSGVSAPSPMPSSSWTQPLFVPYPPPKAAALSPRDATRRVSPLARRLAKERGLDLTSVTGSGPHGRITSRDLAQAKPLSPLSHEPSCEAPGSYEEISLTPMRKTIARRLQESKSFIPHFYVKQSVDAEPLMQIREQLKNLSVKVTVNDLLVRATALALKTHPEVNCGFNSQTQKIVQFKTIDLSIAVNVEGGLITPIVRCADSLPLEELSTQIRLLSQRAREGKLKEDEYLGGSFSISNLGMFGITEFTAVINPPQAAILAIGGIEERAVVKEGHLLAGKQLTLTLSSDHRVIDGATAAQFLKTLQRFVENAAGLLI